MQCEVQRVGFMCLNMTMFGKVRATRRKKSQSISNGCKDDWSS